MTVVLRRAGGTTSCRHHNHRRRRVSGGRDQLAEVTDETTPTASSSSTDRAHGPRRRCRITRHLVLDPTATADQADPEVAGYTGVHPRQHAEQMAAARPPDGWYIG